MRIPAFIRRLTRRFSLGAWGERSAARYLERRLHVIWRRNWRDMRGELDIVAIKNRTVIFVEVKTRTAGTTELVPGDQMTPLKLRRLRRAARSFLESNRIELRRRAVYSSRIDFIGIVASSNRRVISLHHVEDAYELEAPASDFVKATSDKHFRSD